MRLLIGLIALMLLFGCLGEETPPTVVENKTVEKNKTKPPVTIIIEEQENQTVEQNYTEPGPVIPTNETNVTAKEYEYEPDENLGVYFIQVGGQKLHGDAILIKKGDFDMLVDAGPKQNGSRVVDYLRSRGVDDIEVLLSTNADPRHYGGINAVAKNFEIREFWWSGELSGDLEYKTLVENFKNSTKVEKGFTASHNGIKFEMLNPYPNRFGDVNNDAVVTRITDRNFSMLLTSGIQKGVLDKLVNEQPSMIKNLVIQAPYYGVGAGTSGIGLFLITSQPEAMVISGSKDDTPDNGGSREPYMRLMKQYNITYYETYKLGTVRIVSNGQNYSVSGLGS
jgi:beta-lactamase superfamily II metal-dependent hydrolase